MSWVSFNENLQLKAIIIPRDVLWASIVVGVAYLISIVLKKNKKTNSGEKIPGSLGFPFLGETLSFLAAINSINGIYEFVRSRRLRYGKWFKTKYLGKTHVFVPSPEAAKEIYGQEFDVFRKTFVKSIEDVVGKYSVHMASKGDHERHRRIIGEPFSMNNIMKYVPKFDRIVCDRLKKCETDGKSFRVLDFTMKIPTRNLIKTKFSLVSPNALRNSLLLMKTIVQLGFDVLCDTFMSITDATLLSELERDFFDIYEAAVSFPIMVPGTRYYKGIKARARIMATFKKILEDRRSGKTSSDDFLQSLLPRDSYPSNEKLDDIEILDNFIASLVSGQNTTATAMMWIVKFLSDNPHIQDKLREEQLLLLKDGDLEYKDLTDMSYASKVIKESLRLSNIVMWTPRMASEDCTVQGFEIKKGWYVNVDLSHIHTDPTIHQDPLHFDPSRFNEIPKPYTFMPFGAGPRSCMGINMAKATMIVFLHRLITGYKWTLDDLDPKLEMKGFVAKLRNGCPITLKALDRA